MLFRSLPPRSDHPSAPPTHPTPYPTPHLQILPILLTGQPQSGREQAHTREEHQPDERDRQWQEMQQSGGRGSLAELGEEGGPPAGRGGRLSFYEGMLRDSLVSASSSAAAAGGAGGPWRAGRHGNEASLEQQPKQGEGEQQGQQQRGGSSSSSSGDEGEPGGRQQMVPTGHGQGQGPGLLQAQHGRGGGKRAPPPLEDRLSPQDYQRMLQERGIDCRGWHLVVTGHSLGAACAALVAMHLHRWWPGGWVVGQRVVGQRARARGDAKARMLPGPALPCLLPVSCASVGKPSLGYIVARASAGHEAGSGA